MTRNHLTETAEIPRISVIVLNYNGEKHLKECFSSLRDLDYPGDRYEVIMVDNGSTDGSIYFVEQEFPFVRIVRLPENSGYSKGNNIGVQYANYPYIAFLNNDTIVDKKWLMELSAKVMKEDKLIVNSKMVYYHDPNILNQGRGYIYRWGIGFCKGAGEAQDSYNEEVYVHHPTGGAMLLRKDIFTGLGGFDEDFFAYHEDVDFGWRAWLYGYKCLYVPSSVVYHKTGSTLGGFSPHKTFLITRNTLSYITKNCESSMFFSMMAMNITFLFLLSIFFLVPFNGLGLSYMGSAKRAAAIYRGIFSFREALSSVMEKRRKIQHERVISDKMLLKLGLIMPLGESVKYLFTNNFKTVKSLIKAGKPG